MRGLRWTVVAAATTLAGVLMACGTGPAEKEVRASATPSPPSSTTTVVTPAIAPARAATVTVTDETCDRDEALAAVLASGGAVGGGYVDYLECLDGFGWARYRLDADGDAAHVLLSIGAEGYRVLNLGTSVCAIESGMPAEVAGAIAPSPMAADDCPEPAPTGGDGGGEGDVAPDDEGHQPWRDACAEDPTAYAGCQP